MTDSKTHWNTLYRTKSSKDVSWYQPHLDKSLGLMSGLGLKKSAPIIDIGGGASTLPDDLLSGGFSDITVLDISSQALNVSQNRLGDKKNRIHWIEADITQTVLEPEHYDLWHDRAVFHFLTRSDDRQKYVVNLRRALKKGGYLILATFGPNGPTQCSGLDVVRYSPAALLKELGEPFQLLESDTEAHQTPFGTTQNFMYCCFKKSMRE